MNRSFMAFRGAIVMTFAMAPRLEAQLQRLTEEAVPRELATALMSAPRNTGSLETPQIWVGSLPQNLARRIYVPADARVIGGAGAGNSMIAVLGLKGNVESLRPLLRRELGQLGWKTPPPYTYGGGGFRPMPVASDTTMFPSMLCQATEMLLITPVRRDLDATTVVFQVVSGGGVGTCSPPQMPAGMQRTAYPLLFNPPNTVANTMGTPCNQPYGTSSTGTTLVTQLSGDALLDHYGRQLLDSGWVAAGTAPSVVGRTWTKPDSTGAKQELVLSVRTPAGNAAGCREISLQVRPPR